MDHHGSFNNILTFFFRDHGSQWIIQQHSVFMWDSPKPQEPQKLQLGSLFLQRTSKPTKDKVFNFRLSPFCLLLVGHGSLINQKLTVSTWGRTDAYMSSNGSFQNLLSSPW